MSPRNRLLQYKRIGLKLNDVLVNFGYTWIDKCWVMTYIHDRHIMNN